MSSKGIDADDTKREKARQLRYKKPIVRDLNLTTIYEELWDIQEKCEEVHWFVDEDEESLINALEGNEDEAHEFKMMFSDLCAECEQMFNDLREGWVPDCFDTFFVAAGAGDSFGGILGFDSYEQDYYGIDCMDSFAIDEAKRKLKRMTKDDLIESSMQCFKVYQNYIALSHRYDCLKAALDILHDQNTGYLQMVRQIEDVYERAEKESYGFKYGGTRAEQELDRILDNMPQEAWIQ